MKNKILIPYLQALLAAALFGASAPLSKLLLGEVDTILLAALLYLGCGIGVLIFKLIRGIAIPKQEIEAGLSAKDLPWLLGSILAGGVAAPIILMYSLKSTPAATASLLLNFECVATSILAFLIFHEAVGSRIWAGLFLITLSGILLTLNFSGEWGFSPGALGIIIACSLWGLDNNFTRNISAKDPLLTVIWKGLAAGSTSMVIYLAAAGFKMPQIGMIACSLTLGFLSYGFSIILFILALRNLGAARTSAVFGIAPFAGALISFALFNDPLNLLFWVSLPVMLAGTYMLLLESHGHSHHHKWMSHDHRHRHDDGHHDHQHEGVETGDLEHSHQHQHSENEHSHPHTPDDHHRHEH
ncbi:MAG: DMT family transporter [Candidatus Wallbacteria bacterium]|nr:DMT family transporter [Candidatus Wallbacteria bacterium]